MPIENKIPSTEQEWLEEISKAYLDAIDSQTANLQEIYHLAPAVCLKFRGLTKTESNIKKATDAALSSYMATKKVVGDLFDISQMSFAFCYVLSHFGLELLDEKMSSDLLDYIEANLDQLVSATNKE